MTLKSYLRMLLAAVTLLFVTTGCNDDDDKVGPPPSYSFSVAVSDVAQTEATITVTPSDDQATYYYAAVKKAEFDTFESDAAYAQHILDNLQAIADKKVLSLSEYLATALVKGSTPQKITDLTAGTDYYAVALGMLTDGRFTSDLVKEAFKTDDAPEPAPELTLSMRAGDASGANTSSYVTCHIQSSDIASGMAAFFKKDEVDKKLAEGKTLAEILAMATTDTSLKANQIEAINSTAGYDLPCRVGIASTAVTAIVSVTGVNGKTTIDSASATTDAAQSGGDLTFTIAVTNIGAKGADINITPSNDSDTYYFDVYPASVVDQMPDDNQLIAAIISANGGDVTKYLATGPDGYSKELIEQYIPFDPETEYCVVAFGCNGTAGTTAVTKERFTTLADDGETGDGPELTLTMKAGDHTGADPTTKITCLIKSSGVVSAKAGLWTKAAIDDAINNQGMTIEQIINNEQNGEAIKDEYMTGINGAGLNYTWNGASPATEYTAIIKVTDAAGNSTIKSATGATESAGEGSDAYKAWLGTWTVTSTSSEVNKAPVSFDVVIGQNVANSSYSVTGWSVTAVREVLPVNAVFDAETGRMGILNEQEMTTVNFEGVDYMVTYISRCLSGGKYTYVFGDYAGLIGELDAGKSKATVVGNTLQLQGGGEAAVHSMEFFGFEVNDGDGMIRYNPADGYTNGDYPIGPYTMTKKSSSSALPASKSAVHNASLMDAAKLSSVLSSRTAVAVTSPEQNGVVFESQVAMPSSLVFDRPRAVIGNSGNFENAGLKKQISNNLDDNTDFQLLNRL